MKRFGAVFMLLAVNSLAFSQIYLSEIMYNPIGNERYHEFVELYNAGTSETIDLTGWQVGDADRTSEIIAHQNGLLLAPGQYALVLVENYFANSTDYDSLIPPDALIITIEHSQIGSYGLSNSRAETVLLINPDGTVADSMTYDLDNDNGISEERRIFTKPFEQDAWCNSLQENGTPGYRNSTAPKAIDVGIVPNTLTISPDPPQPGADAEITLSVQNTGTDRVDAFALLIDSYPRPDENQTLVDDTLWVYNLLPAEERVISCTWSDPAGGCFTIRACCLCAGDGNTLNNRDSLSIIGGYPPGSAVINEIMYSPATDQAEWFEIYNPGPTILNLEQWLILDNDGQQHLLADSTIWLTSEQFAVIAEDSTIYSAMDSKALLLTPGYFPGLRNDADSIVLRDATGSVLDSLHYTSDWGGAKGISLEKLNPLAKSWQSSNWTNCVHGQGHTAGSANSIHTNVLPSTGSLRIAPNPFSPDGDGIDDHAAINYNLPEQTSRMNIRIFDMKGRMVRFLCNNKACASKGVEFWNGLNDEGLMCRIGIYLVLLEKIEYGMGVTDRITHCVVLARPL